MKPASLARLAALISFLGCASLAWAQVSKNPKAGNIRISVVVRYTNGSQTHQGIMVRLEEEGGGVVSEQPTDSSGKVILLPPAPGAYIVSVSEPGYRELQSHVDLTMSPTATVLFDLVPLPGNKDQNDLSKALQGLGDTVSVTDLSIPDDARKEFELGQKILMVQHDVSGSIEHFQKAIQMDNSFPQAYTMLGMAYVQEKQWKDAQTALEKAVQLDPKSGPAYLFLGASLNQEKDYAAAEKVLTRGLELEPQAPEGHYELAKTYWALGHWQEAEPHAVKAVSMEPNLPPVHVLMGNILLRKRDNQGALKEYQEYLRLDPKGPMAPAVQGVVDKIQKALAQKSPG